jgi:hypothetical protein
VGDLGPEPARVAAIHQKVVCGFQGASAKGTGPEWSRPLRASLSHVHTRSCRMSQAKNLHLGGAQTFQIDARSGVAGQPVNWALYAEDVV